MKYLKIIGASLALILGLAAALVLWPPPTAPLPERTQRLLLTDARIVDVERATVSAPTRVLIEHGRIARIADDLKPEPGLATLSAGGAFLIPGLVDMHSHSWKVSPQLHLPLQVAHGITAVRDMMGCPELEDPMLACSADKRRWSAAAERGELVSPRFLGNASFYYEDAALTPAAADARARADKARGADFLKVYNKLSAPAYQSLSRQARAIGLPVVGHLPRQVSLLTAIESGQRSLEHGRIFIEGCFGNGAEWRAGRLQHVPRAALLQAMLDQRDEALCAKARQAMATKAVAFVPTLVTREEDARAQDQAFLDDPRLRYADPMSRWAWKDDQSGTQAAFPGKSGDALLKRFLAQAMADTLSAHRAGIPVFVGSDTIIAGPRYHDELALLVRAGLTPAEVLRAATLDSARWLQRDREFGSVAVGKRADLLLIDGNPLDDIGNVGRIRAVILGGHVYDRGRINALLDFTRRQENHPANWAKILWGYATSPIRSSL